MLGADGAQVRGNDLQVPQNLEPDLAGAGQDVPVAGAAADAAGPVLLADGFPGVVREAGGPLGVLPEAGVGVALELEQDFPLSGGRRCFFIHS